MVDTRLSFHGSIADPFWNCGQGSWNHGSGPRGSVFPGIAKKWQNCGSDFRICGSAKGSVVVLYETWFRPPDPFGGFGGGKPVPATMVYTLMFRHNAQDNLVCLSVYKTNRNTHFLVCSELISQQTIRRSVKWSLSMNFLVCTSICLL